MLDDAYELSAYELSVAVRAFAFCRGAVAAAETAEELRDALMGALDPEVWDLRSSTVGTRVL